MKTLLLFIAIVLIIAPLHAQSPTITWDNTIGGVSGDELYDAKQTSDGGYILSGFSSSDSSEDKAEDNIGQGDYWIIKLDATGAVSWENTIGGTAGDFATSVQQTADGGYIVGGHSSSNSSADKSENNIGLRDYWVVKLNASGTVEWDNTIGGTDRDDLNDIKQTSDGGYILSGFSFSNSSADKSENNLGEEDYWIVKLNASGSIEWENTIGGTERDILQYAEQTSDGGYILCGYSESNSSADKSEDAIGFNDYWVVKLDASGEIVWDHTIGGTGGDTLYSAQQTTDGGYILGGISSSDISGDKTENNIGIFDYWVVKLDSSGSVIWDNTIGGNSFDELRSIQQTMDEGYIVGGFSDSNSSGDKTENSLGGNDYWIVKLAPSGEVVWDKTIGGAGIDTFGTVQQTVDGGYFVAGDSTSDSSLDKSEDNIGFDDYWVVKLDSDLALQEFGANNINLYPNPTNGLLTISLETMVPFVDIEITNILGQTIESKRFQNSKSIVVSLADKKTGLYLINIATPNKETRTFKVSKY